MSASSLSGNLRLAWHDHGSELVRLASDLCGQSELTDVTLSCAGGVTFNAHRLVLAGASTYFRSMFAAVRDGWRHPVIFLRDVEPADMEYFMQFIYHGEVDVPARELENLVQVARTLGIKGFERIPTKSASWMGKGSQQPQASSASKRPAPKRLSLVASNSPEPSGSMVKKVKLKQEESYEETLETINQDDEDAENPADKGDADGEKSDEEDAEQPEGEEGDVDDEEEQEGEEEEEEEEGPDEHVYTGEEDGDNTVEVLETNKGSDKVAMNGFQYTLAKKYLNHLAWRCAFRGCRGLINSDLCYLQAQLKRAHRHPPDTLAVEKVKSMNKLKRLALSCSQGPSELLREFLADLPPEVVAVMPAKESLVRFVCKTRQVQNKALGIKITPKAKKKPKAKKPKVNA